MYYKTPDLSVTTYPNIVIDIYELLAAYLSFSVSETQKSPANQRGKQALVFVKRTERQEPPY